jgi:hypothetical protein
MYYSITASVNSNLSFAVLYRLSAPTSTMIAFLTTGLALLSISQARQIPIPEEKAAKAAPEPTWRISAAPNFEFENPRTDCKYASQPFIYEMFNGVREDMSKLLGRAAPNIHLQIRGHHPFAGHYYDPRIAFVNSLWRCK